MNCNFKTNRDVFDCVNTTMIYYFQKNHFFISYNFEIVNYIISSLWIIDVVVEERLMQSVFETSLWIEEKKIFLKVFGIKRFFFMWSSFFPFETCFFVVVAVVVVLRTTAMIIHSCMASRKSIETLKVQKINELLRWRNTFSVFAVDKSFNTCRWKNLPVWELFLNLILYFII